MVAFLSDISIPNPSCLIYKKIQAQTSSISVLVFNSSCTDKILYLCFLDLRLNIQKRLMEIAKILIIVTCVVTMAISKCSASPVSHHHCHRHHHEQQQQQALLILKEPGCSLINEAPNIQVFLQGLSFVCS